MNTVKRMNTDEIYSVIDQLGIITPATRDYIMTCAMIMRASLAEEELSLAQLTFPMRNPDFCESVVEHLHALLESRSTNISKRDLVDAIDRFNTTETIRMDALESLLMMNATVH